MDKKYIVNFDDVVYTDEHYVILKKDAESKGTLFSGMELLHIAITGIVKNAEYAHLKNHKDLSELMNGAIEDIKEIIELDAKYRGGKDE